MAGVGMPVIDKDGNPIDWDELARKNDIAVQEMLSQQRRTCDADRDKFAVLAKGVPALEAYLAQCPQEDNSLERLVWNDHIGSTIEKALPNLGKWYRTKANVANHRFDLNPYSNQWPDEREDWYDIKGYNPDDEDMNLRECETLYETSDLFRRRCHAAWDEDDANNKELQLERAVALRNRVFWTVVYCIKFSKIAKALRASRQTHA